MSLGLLLAIGWTFDGWSIFRAADPGWLALALALALLLDVGVGAVKWWWILRRLGQPLALADVWRVWTGLLPMTFFAPLQSGHALYPVALSRALGVPGAVAVESVVYDKGVSLASTFALIAVGQLLLPEAHPWARWWIAGGAGLAALAFVVDAPLRALLRQIPGLAARSVLLSRPLPLRDRLGLLLVGMVYQCSDSLSVWLGALALGLPLSPELALGAFPLALLASYVPLTFSGFGVREPAAALVLGTALTWDQGVAAGLAVDGLEYVAPALVGLVCLPWLLRRMARPSAAGTPS